MQVLEELDLELRTYNLMDRISLELYVAVGQSMLPTGTTKLFTKVMRKVMKPGDIVFDIGSGVGPLGIWAAKKDSGSVFSVEIVPEQYRIIEQNIILNNVEDIVSPYCGSLFVPIPEGVRADLIVAYVSAVADGPAQLWYSLNIPNGGEDGTVHIVPALEQAKHFMNPGARLIFPSLVGLSDSDKIMTTAHSHYSHVEKMIEVPIPLEGSDLQLFRNSARGRSFLQLKDYNGKQCWTGEIYLATNPKY